MSIQAKFADSKLSVEQKALFQAELKRFSDLIVESSKMSDRTERLYFEIVTGDNVPIRQRPF